MICWQELMSLRPEISAKLTLLGVWFGALLGGVILAAGVRAAPIDQILAVVNDHLITESDIRIQKDFKLQFKLVVENEDPLQFAINQILLLDDSDKFGIGKPTTQEIDAAIAVLASDFGSGDKLDQKLKEDGISRGELDERLVRFLICKKFVEQRINYFIFISDTDIENYYTEHQADWNGSGLVTGIRNQINSILFEQKRKMRLEEYLNKRRSKTTIRINQTAAPVLPNSGS